MMNSNSTHKIVVGIGLAVVFGVGVSVFAVRAKQASEAARGAPASALAAPADQNATDTTTPPQSPGVPTPTDQSATVPAAPPVSSVTAPAAVAPGGATGATAGEQSSPAQAKALDRTVSKTRSRGSSADTSRTRVASAGSNTSPAQAAASSSSDTTSSSPAGAAADAQQAPTQTAQEATMTADAVAPSSEPVVSDSQITASVKAEIATAAPDSNVDVTTSNGVVELAGSVPSPVAVDQAKRAAQRVAGVKQVDASGLTVGNKDL